jgi:dihydropteroate synthase
MIHSLHRLLGDRPLIMGILNVTPDSFSDGGRYERLEGAVSHALRMVEEGADIIDVGGESTRPGAQRVAATEQILRVTEIIRAVRAALPPQVLISIDTTLAPVAEMALTAGAAIVNDVAAGGEDPDMFSLVAKHDVPLILMHMQGTPETMQQNPTYTNVVAEVRDFLLERAMLAQDMGVKREQICFDPGIGFGKTKEHNMALIAHLHVFADTGYPVLLGTSRKRFMGSICAETDSVMLVGATCATTTLGVMAGVKIFRVHDVRPNRQAMEVAWAIKRDYIRKATDKTVL